MAAMSANHGPAYVPLIQAILINGIKVIVVKATYFGPRISVGLATIAQMNQASGPIVPRPVNCAAMPTRIVAKKKEMN